MNSVPAKLKLWPYLLLWSIAVIVRAAGWTVRPVGAFA